MIDGPRFPGKNFFNFQISIDHGHNVIRQVDKVQIAMCNCSVSVQTLSQCLNEITNEMLQCILKKQAKLGIRTETFYIQAHLCPLLINSLRVDAIFHVVHQRIMSCQMFLWDYYRTLGFILLYFSDSLQGVIHRTCLHCVLFKSGLLTTIFTCNLENCASSKRYLPPQPSRNCFLNLQNGSILFSRIFILHTIAY